MYLEKNEENIKNLPKLYLIVQSPWRIRVALSAAVFLSIKGKIELVIHTRKQDIASPKQSIVTNHEMWFINKPRGESLLSKCTVVSQSMYLCNLLAYNQGNQRSKHETFKSPLHTEAKQVTSDKHRDVKNGSTWASRSHEQGFVTSVCSSQWLQHCHFWGTTQALQICSFLNQVAHIAGDCHKHAFNFNDYYWCCQFNAVSTTFSQIMRSKISLREEKWTPHFIQNLRSIKRNWKNLNSGVHEMWEIERGIKSNVLKRNKSKQFCQVKYFLWLN